MFMEADALCFLLRRAVTGRLHSAHLCDTGHGCSMRVLDLDIDAPV